ncbi:MAG: radical SAM protein [Rhodospirillaceae bacterium]|jgi:MoaA/NifB/PqqE/SkfB family radical SAM enzyme|nr:radical SAM protein [Rhodospirillaceae bacterium]MBT4487050.1 radical SAM protein [Rhodospirillaceae bacterium]MBT5193243.1 radical SAM protein [Rhodospirillaceae bacterium]MBT5896332.1 radical SAM protein [Rhodospirillaceae bacterium]MBT6426248.1 radical SAM protein [Rhodospirillaceae bacterium]
MTSVVTDKAPLTLDRGKFNDPRRTLDGQARAAVTLNNLDTLWFNTGTLCNLTCTNCYIESSPTNDRLAYLTAAEVGAMLDELQTDWQAREVGFTGGEPFMNPDILAMLEDALGRGYRVLVLTNAMRPMMKLADGLLALRNIYGEKLCLRVSVDHYARDLHDLERGEHGWDRMLTGLTWLARNGFNINIAGRTLSGEEEDSLRQGYARLFVEHDIPVDAGDGGALVLFPEMDEDLDVPEITTACWGILDVSPDGMMCATSRMVVKHKGDGRLTVMPCTLLPYDERFKMGATLADASSPVALNHPHCARFCVLGGGSCSVA